MSRRKLPDTRKSITHKVEITDPSSGQFDLYITLGLYPRGRPGEVFLTMGKVGSTINGLLDVVGVLTSLALQHGASAEHLGQKLANTSFSPCGTTSNPDIPECSSIADYVFRWLASNPQKKRKPVVEWAAWPNPMNPPQVQPPQGEGSPWREY